MYFVDVDIVYREAIFHFEMVISVIFCSLSLPGAISFDVSRFFFSLFFSFSLSDVTCLLCKRKNGDLWSRQENAIILFGL